MMRILLLLPFLLIRCKAAAVAAGLTAARPPWGEDSDLQAQSKADGAGSAGVVPAELWCVAKNNAEDGPLQAALDWACGPGGADCQPIQQGGACFEPNDLQFHASYAFNDYYLRNGVSEQACDFGSTAALTSLDPGIKNCHFPSSSSARNGSLTASTAAGLGPTGADRSGFRIGASWWPRPLTVAVLLAFAAAPPLPPRT